MLLEELSRFIGETVTIFTTSGGASGCGFTGTLLRVNSCFVTLVSHLGTAPTNPLSEAICGDRTGSDSRDNHDRHDRNNFRVGSVIDIPVDRIAAFNHNAL